jgi:translocation and assembly module TamA
MSLLRPAQWRRIRNCCVLLACFAITPAAWAERLTGIAITGLNNSQTESVRASLSLSQLSDAQRESLTPGRLAFLLRRAERETLSALEPFGLYNSAVEIATEADGEGIQVRIAVDPGQPVRVTESAIAVHGPAGDEAAITALITAFRPSVGQVFVHSRYENSKSAIARELARRGYFAADTAHAST